MGLRLRLRRGFTGFEIAALVALVGGLLVSLGLVGKKQILDKKADYETCNQFNTDEQTCRDNLGCSWTSRTISSTLNCSDISVASCTNYSGCTIGESTIACPGPTTENDCPNDCRIYNQGACSVSNCPTAYCSYRPQVAAHCEGNARISNSLCSGLGQSDCQAETCTWKIYQPASCSARSGYEEGFNAYGGCSDSSKRYVTGEVCQGTYQTETTEHYCSGNIYVPPNFATPTPEPLDAGQIQVTPTTVVVQCPGRCSDTYKYVKANWVNKISNCDGSNTPPWPSFANGGYSCDYNCTQGTQSHNSCLPPQEILPTAVYLAPTAPLDAGLVQGPPTSTPVPPTNTPRPQPTFPPETLPTAAAYPTDVPQCTFTGQTKCELGIKYTCLDGVYQITGSCAPPTPTPIPPTPTNTPVPPTSTPTPTSFLVQDAINAGFTLIQGGGSLPVSTPTPLWQKAEDVCKGKKEGDICSVDGRVGGCKGSPPVCDTSNPLATNPLQYGQAISNLGNYSNNQAEKFVFEAAGTIVNQATSNLAVVNQLATKKNKTKEEELALVYAGADLFSQGALSGITSTAVDWRDKCWGKSSDLACWQASAIAGGTTVLTTAPIVGEFVPGLQAKVMKQISTTLDDFVINDLKNSLKRRPIVLDEATRLANNLQITDEAARGTIFAEDSLLPIGNAVHKSKNSNQILIIDPRRDSRLQTFIDKAPRYNDPQTQFGAQQLNDFVYTEINYSNTNRSNIYENKGGTAWLGDLTKQGVCREKASCLHVTMADQGGQSYVVTAFIKNPNSPNKVLQDGGRHAWVEFIDKNTGEWMVADPTWNFVQKRDAAYVYEYGTVKDRAPRAFVWPENTSQLRLYSGRIKGDTSGVLGGVQEQIVSLFDNKPKIGDAQNFDELFNTLTFLGSLKGSSKTYTANELIELITDVVQGKKNIEKITRTEGLRETVERLLNP